MDLKEAMSILLLFIMLFIGIAAMSASYGADVDVVRDFDNNTLTTVELSESQSKTIWGFENLAKVQTRTGGDMQNTHIETDEGLWNYEYMILNDTIMEKNDRLYGKNGNQTLYAHYGFTPYMFAEIDVIDLHGHSGSNSTYPAMKTMDDSITKTFKGFTDVESGYTPLYILDLDTNVKYQPGDNFTITYSDVLNNGLNRLIKMFQYVYAKDIVVENVIDRTIFNDTIVDRVIYNDTIINRDVYNDTIIDRILYNDTIVDRIIYNDTVVDRIIFNDTIINREVYNDTVINRVIFNDTVIDRIVYNDTIVNRIIENITYVDKVIENITYVNKTIENITYVNKTIEIPFYKIIIIPKIIINEVVNPIQNNTNTDQYNKTNPINYQNNNTTNLNNITNNINKENNTSTPISDNLKTVNMKKTGNTFGLILVIILFIILIQLYNREE